MLLLRLKASGLDGRRDTTSILQSLLSLAMSYESESWVATLTVEILLVTSGSKPEVVLHNTCSS